MHRAFELKYRALATFLLLAGCQSSPTGACHLALAAAIPFTMQSDHLTIAPLLNGAPTDMWLDTGAQFTTLSTKAARRLSLRLERLNGYISGIGGSTQIYGFTAKTLQIGRLRGKNFELGAADMGLRSNGQPIDGLLGADFLASYDVDLDVGEGRVVLYKTLGDCGEPATALHGDLYVVPFSANRNRLDVRPHIRVQIGGKTLVALVDSGTPHTVLFRDSARRIGLNTASFATDLRFKARGVGPDARNAVRHVLTPITIGELTVSHLPVAIIDQAAPLEEDMLLGMDFLARVHSWFAFSSKNLILQYPSLPSPPLPQVDADP